MKGATIRACAKYSRGTPGRRQACHRASQHCLQKPCVPFRDRHRKRPAAWDLDLSGRRASLQNYRRCAAHGRGSPSPGAHRCTQNGLVGLRAHHRFVVHEAGGVVIISRRHWLHHIKQSALTKHTQCFGHCPAGSGIWCRLFEKITASKWLLSKGISQHWLR